MAVMQNKKGTIIMVDENKLFGFIKPAGGGQDVFFHFRQGPRNGRGPKEDDRVVFDAIPSPKGPKAVRWEFAEHESVPPVLRVWSGEKMDLLHENIIGNVQKFGLDDSIVVGVISARDLHTKKEVNVQVGPMLLSELCLDVASNTDKTGRYRKFGKDTLVFREDAQIGRVDSEGRFHYLTASCLREALGWIVATSAGRIKVLAGFNLDGTAKGLETVIGQAPVRDGVQAISKFCRATFEPHIQKMFPKPVRSVRQHFGTEDFLWTIGTKLVHGQALPYSAAA